MLTVERFVPTGGDIESVEFTPGKVHAAIKKLKVGGASGPGGFPQLLFKTTADCCIVGPLSRTFLSFMSVGKIPSESHAIATPVHKGGSASSVSNYRPVLILKTGSLH